MSILSQELRSIETAGRQDRSVQGRVEGVGTEVRGCDVPELPENSQDNDGVAYAEKLTAEEEILYASAKDAIKGSVGVLNEMLGRFITLNTALIGGGFALAKGDVIGRTYAIAAVLLFTSSLAFSLVGVWPRAWKFDLVAIEEIKSVEYGTREWKSQMMIGAGILFFAGFIVGIIGLIAASSTHS